MRGSHAKRGKYKPARETSVLVAHHLVV
jgi:hypothetical protein